MLHDLHQYALQRGLTGMPGFNRKQADWVIHLTRDGKLLDVVKESVTLDMCPHLTQPELVSGGVTRSHFLLDTVATVIGGEGKDAAKHEYFVNLLEEAASSAPALKACGAALSDADILSDIKARLTSSRARPVDKATFRVDGMLVVNDTAWHAWWREFRKGLKSAKTGAVDEMRCFVTGEMAEPAKTQPKVSGLARVGGQPAGSSLISFDKEAFGSFDLEQSCNAACSEEAAVAYRNAINALIEAAPPPLAGTLVLHWYKEPVADEDDMFAGIFDIGKSETDQVETGASSQEVAKLITAIRDGSRRDLLSNRYYALVVSGSGGRVMVRDWFQDSFPQLVKSVDAWFRDLEICLPRGGGLTRPPKLFALASRLLDRRPGERVRDLADRMDKQLSPMMPRIWRSIIQGVALPDDVARRALLYARSDLLRASDGGVPPVNLDWIAVSLMKAWYNRKYRQSPFEGGREMASGIDASHPSAAYHAGRMMAVLAEIQRRALGDVGASIVQRYFAAASSTPALVLGRLVRTAQFHLDKLPKGSAVYYERLLSDIACKLGPSVPLSLSLEEQTLFALGYYQQRAARPESEKTNDKKEVAQ